MRVELRAKLLHLVASSLVLLFTLQLAIAVVCEFGGARAWLGRALYPISLGRSPVSPENILANILVLVIALAAYAYGDILQGESFFQEHVAKRKRVREGTVHFSQ
jgi:small-conductance mechanosensitive channel